MLPRETLDLIRCPRCSGGLTQPDETSLSCNDCSATYQVIEDIPVLLDGDMDEVGGVIQSFYESEWKAGDEGVPRARGVHEDLSDLGQRYIHLNEHRFRSTFDSPPADGLFLDAGCGAQPRIPFGERFSRHVCVDFSIEGLLDARRQIGDRAICVCGSLTNLPFKDGQFSGVLASHVLYHIQADNQFDAVSELARVVKPDGKLLVFYGNPTSLERRLVGLARKLLRRSRSDMTSGGHAFYFHAHPIPVMRERVEKGMGPGNVTAHSLRLFGRQITQKPFAIPVLGRCAYWGVLLTERIFAWAPGLATYTAYVGTKRS